jgi:GT2 family glycosyltransferase
VHIMAKNAGYAGGMNAGIGLARGQYIAFLNNDTEPDARWLEELTACIQRHPRAASVTSKVLMLSDQHRLDDAGDELSWYLVPFRRGRGELDIGQYDDEVQVFSASGAACMWRADVVRELGMFDEDFFAYYEDVDLGFRARLAGYECWYAPRAVVYHAIGASAATNESVFVHFHPIKNRWMMILKNVPTRLLWTNCHKIAFAELLIARRSFAKKHFRAALRGYLAAARMLSRTLAKRREIQSKRVLSDRQLRALVTPKYPPGGSCLLRMFQRK